MYSFLTYACFQETHQMSLQPPEVVVKTLPWELPVSAVEKSKTTWNCFSFREQELFFAEQTIGTPF
jgi:hypothetical protein